MKSISLYILFLTIVFLFTGCKNSSNNKITIATAANMQYTMKALTTAFYSQSGIECELVISSSGKLTAQIKEGAPYDIFIAANLKYPKAIYNSGFSVNPPKVYAYGKLVLWSTVKNIKPSLKELMTSKVKHIALANPKTAPYGSAAIEVLNHNLLLDTLESKLVYGEHISQVNQFIASNAAEIGFTAMSVVLSDQLKNKGQWKEIDSTSYTPISQGIVLIKHEEKENLLAELFYEFLFSKEAKLILKKFGYSVDE